MVDPRFIAAWTKQAPWGRPEQVEQDLLLSRVLVVMFQDAFLREQLAFRGGTALHKLFLKPAPRYSEDIDLVQRNTGPVKPILQRLGEVIDFFEMPRNTQVKGHGAKALYRFLSTGEGLKMRLKIEINCREHFSVLPIQEMPFALESDWASGQAMIPTYALEELLGTKMRALYQRKKGRDLFDLYYAQGHHEVDWEQVVACFKHYMTETGANHVPTQKEFRKNLAEKRENVEFLNDMKGVIRLDLSYDQAGAFAWFEESILPFLK